MRLPGYPAGNAPIRFDTDDVRVTIETSRIVARHDVQWRDMPAQIDADIRGNSRGGLSGWQQKRVRDYIDAHLAEALRLAMLAPLVGLSPFHFARAFKQSFGVPPHRYHVGRRIARAMQMLDDRNRSVTAIARDLGFAETSSFSATFRRVTGVSPMRYRRERP
jgi:AraC family transcriptional regulator